VTQRAALFLFLSPFDLGQLPSYADLERLVEQIHEDAIDPDLARISLGFFPGLQSKATVRLSDRQSVLIRRHILSAPVKHGLAAALSRLLLGRHSMVDPLSALNDSNGRQLAFDLEAPESGLLAKCSTFGVSALDGEAYILPFPQLRTNPLDPADLRLER